MRNFYPIFLFTFRSTLGQLEILFVEMSQGYFHMKLIIILVEKGGPRDFPHIVNVKGALRRVPISPPQSRNYLRGWKNVLMCSLGNWSQKMNKTTIQQF